MIKRTPTKKDPVMMTEAGPSFSESEQDTESNTSSRRVKRRALRSPELINSFKLESTLSSFKRDITETMTHLFTTFQANQDTKFALLMTDISVIKEEVKEIKSLNAETEEKINALTSHYEEVSTKTTNLENAISDSSWKIKQLESKVEDLTRQSCAYKIELRNIPSKPQEAAGDLLHLVDSLLKTLNIETSPTEVRNVRRAPGKPDAPRPIVFEVSTTELKYKIIKEARNFNSVKPEKLNTSHLSIPGTPRPVYVGENLTYKAKGLFHKAREFAKQNQYAFCWTSNGLIYLRKEEGSKGIVVKDEEQLDNMELKA